MAKKDLDELIEESEEAIAKGADLSEVSAEHHHKDNAKGKSQKLKVDEEVKKAKFEKPASTEVEKENIETQKAEDIDGEKGEVGETAEKSEDKETPKTKQPAKKGKAKVRSKKYLQAKEGIEANKKYDLDEAIELVKKSSYTKFDGNIEAHLRILGKTGKPEKVRGLINYPYSTGKKVKVVVLDDKLIEEIGASKKISADIYLATPEMMPKVAKLAKILGPKGKMPNPKAGTVTANVEKTKAEMEGGQTEYKSDDYGIVHQVIGKVSSKNDELKENFQALIAVLPVDKISSIHLCATMGPAVKVQK